MSEQFDPYAPDAVAGNDSDGVYFGEVVLYRGFQGIWIRDETLGKSQLWDYDPNNDQHKAIIASGKRAYVYYAVQFFPIGVSFDTRVDNLANFSDEWQELCKSLVSLWGVEKVKSSEFSDHLRQWAGKSIFGKWQTEIVEYKDNGGTDRKKYIKRMVELYPDLAAAEKAHDAHRGINGKVGTVPMDFKVQALPKEQALTFVKTLAQQVATENEGICEPAKLQEKIDSLPMLGDLSVDDPDVHEIVKATGVPF